MKYFHIRESPKFHNFVLWWADERSSLWKEIWNLETHPQLINRIILSYPKPLEPSFVKIQSRDISFAQCATRPKLRKETCTSHWHLYIKIQVTIVRPSRRTSLPGKRIQLECGKYYNIRPLDLLVIEYCIIQGMGVLVNSAKLLPRDLKCPLPNV